MALGARGGDVGRMILREALILTILALSIGLACALVLTRALRSLLFGVSPTDPGTLLAVSAAVLAVAALSAFLPAWRATRVDPMVALRYE
jgi:ABC-type antimicrobial peptide transport system permease subunit